MKVFKHSLKNVKFLRANLSWNKAKKYNFLMYKREPICVERKIIWLFLVFPAEAMKMSEPLLSMLQIPEIMIFAILKDSLHIQERSLGSRYNSYDRTITFPTVEKNGVPYIRYTESDR